MNPRLIFLRRSNFQVRPASQELKKLKAKPNFELEKKIAQNYRKPQVLSHRSERIKHQDDPTMLSDFSIELHKVGSPPKQCFNVVLHPLRRALTTQIRTAKKPLQPTFLEEDHEADDQVPDISTNMPANSNKSNKASLRKSTLKQTQFMLDLGKDDFQKKMMERTLWTGKSNDYYPTVKASFFEARKRVETPQKTRSKLLQATELSILKEYQYLNSKPKVKIWDLQFNEIKNKRKYSVDH